MVAQPAQDPSTSSYYVGDAFYQALVDAFTGWDVDDRAIIDPAERDTARAFLEREARLLDQNRHEDWLGLFAPECAYWIWRCRRRLWWWVWWVSLERETYQRVGSKGAKRSPCQIPHVVICVSVPLPHPPYIHTHTREKKTQPSSSHRKTQPCTEI